MKRVTLFCGHYGSGKSNIAVNYAERIASTGASVALADIDIVNPYFRSADSRRELEAAGVQVIALPFANSNVDLPALPQEVYGLVQRRDIHAVLDVGGDDRGALALGRFVPYILEENDYEMLFVVNFFRPLTPDAASAFKILKEIEEAAGMRFTGIVNNSNLGPETTEQVIEQAAVPAKELSRLSGLPCVMTVFEERFMGKVHAEHPFPIHLQEKKYMLTK